MLECFNALTCYARYARKLTKRRGCDAYCAAVLCADPGDGILRTHCRRCVRWYGWAERYCGVEVAVHCVRLHPFIRETSVNTRSEGAVTAFVAIFGFFLLPNTPLTTSWLTPEERQMAHDRMERDRVGDAGEKVSMMEGLKQACKDKRTWLFCLMQNFHLSACSFNSFFPTVVKTLGFNRTITLVLTCPPFLFAGAAGIMTGWSSGRLHERTWHITAGLSVAIVGFVIAASTMNTAGRYVACFIFPVGAYSVNSVIIGWASSTLSQTKEKKAVVLAMTNVGGQIGYIYGAYLWPDTDSPRFGIGFGASAGFALLSIACAWAIRVLLIRENKKLKESTDEHINLYGY